ncbi:MAG: TlyA family RNA methyltransferase [Pseudomonadota bacterium]
MSDRGDRADKVLVALGHFDSRASAQAAIAAGGVSVNGRVLRKASETIAAGAHIVAEPAHPWVSRGGVKLAHALDLFKVDPVGRDCLDIGASTGGFSEVLLARGAAHVVAVDVGHGQISAKLAGEKRLISLEGRDARTLTQADLPTPPQLVVCDASFISLQKLLGVPLSLAADGAALITLFKPQFEVGKAYVGKGGIVRDEQAAKHAEDRFCDWLTDQGWAVHQRADSPIRGGDGNAERLIWAIGKNDR